MIFKNREVAAKLLSKKLKHYAGKNPLVLGIPRGAIPMAAIIAKDLQGELNAILVHKIPDPYNEEFAIASIGLSGKIQMMPYTNTLELPTGYLEEAAQSQLKKLRQRQKQYGLIDPSYENRIVIIVDDGIATGATTLSAIQEVRAHHPQKIIVAAAVSSQESAIKLDALADEVMVLETPRDFYAVGQFFQDFSQVSDETVMQIFHQFRKTN